MILICGLGNPGDEYQLTRHNIGFLFIDYLADKILAPTDSLKSKYKALYAQTNYLGHSTILVKPQTFMNNSGIAVYELAHFYKIPSENIIVIHDELDIGFGQIKTKFAGGHAGHNGLRDIDKRVGNKYHRIRVGIDHPRNTLTPQMSPADYVLQKFSASEQKDLDNLYSDIESRLEKLVSEL